MYSELKKKSPNSSNSFKSLVTEGETDLPQFHTFSKPLAKFLLWGDAEQAFPKALNPKGEKPRPPRGTRMCGSENPWTLYPQALLLLPLL